MAYRHRNLDGSFNRKALPNVFSKEQLVDLFNCIEQPKIAVATMIGYFCALRISEVVKLKVADLDFDARKLKVVNGKMYKDRYVHMPKKIIPIIKKWLWFVGNDPYLFPSRKRPGYRISKKTLFNDYSHWLEKAELKIPTGEDIRGNMRYRYNFHTLRHSRATHLHQSGLPITHVQKFLGHTFLDTTMIYTHITDVDLETHVDDIDTGVNMIKRRDEPREQKIIVEHNDPLSMLKMRLARGEIGVDEFKSLKRTLELEVYN